MFNKRSLPQKIMIFNFHENIKPCTSLYDVNIQLIVLNQAVIKLKQKKNNPTSKKENVMIFVSPEAKEDLIAR